MTRLKSLFAAVVVTAIVAVVPAANAQTVHFVGAGSSAQFLMAAIATDQAACTASGQTSPCTATGGTGTIKHWNAKNGGYVSDNRDTLNRITNEVGNINLVWIEDISGNVTDAWFLISVDSTVGVRTFSAQEKVGGVQVSGGQVQITVATSYPSDKLVSPQTLWPDNAADAALTTNALNAINTSVSGGVHVNVGLTDIRAEDALFATTRALTALNTTTWAGLGYVGPTGNIGAPIFTAQGTGTNATPIKFGLSGQKDPFNTTYEVPPYISIPIGAAPIVFIANNNGSSTFPKNLITGVSPGLHYNVNPPQQTYPLEQLFAGVVPCTTDAGAFGGNDDGGGTALTLFLREPLSGTMNTTEYSLFRSFGDNGVAPANSAYGSQETGIINPTRAPYNPLNLGCPTAGNRERSIGTGEVVGKAGVDGLLNVPNSLGYIFFSFANASKFGGSANFNYMTLDGVDPLALGTANQELPNCSGTTCPASLWSGSLSYPHLRDGTYKAWSIYRWLTVPNSDPFGPAAVAQAAQDYVDSDVADFVPFQACPSGDTTPICSSTNPDGLEVYRSHYTQSGFTAVNGNATHANTLDNGNTLGGGDSACPGTANSCACTGATTLPNNSGATCTSSASCTGTGATCAVVENGGDMGGLIEGPFGTTLTTTNGYVITTNVLTTGKGYKVTWKGGTKFKAGTSWEGGSITINGVAYTISSCTSCSLTATVLYVTGSPTIPPLSNIALAYAASETTTYPAATAPGVISKKQ